MSRKSSKVDEICYTKTHFDTAEETYDKQIWNQYKKSKYSYKKTTKFMSNVLEAINKLKLKNSKNHFSNVVLYLPAYSYTDIEWCVTIIRHNMQTCSDVCEELPG